MSKEEVCANCGITGVDDIKLMDCDGCDLVKYCSDNCQGNHREQHEQECNKRKADVHDKKLFTQPDISHLGECPICYLPLPIDECKSRLAGCCCKFFCMGCEYANIKREDEQGLERRCPFCREPLATSQEEFDKKVMERIKNNDPIAMTQMGKIHRNEGDFVRALEYFTTAAELGDAAAHGCLGLAYLNGEGVDKDTKKAVYHLEQAAIGGHPTARGCLGDHEEANCRFERAAKHYIIAANLGHDYSLQCIKDLYANGHASKEDYADALRAYQAAVDATKSAERKKAETLCSGR